MTFIRFEGWNEISIKVVDASEKDVPVLSQKRFASHH
jgi:hypothetical protein